MSARDRFHSQLLNPLRIRRADRSESSAATVSTAPRPARCSRCHELREAGQLVQDGGGVSFAWEDAMFEIRDYPGVLPVKAMRHYFEEMIRQTDKFRTSYSLQYETRNGQFSNYTDHGTDAFWVGFACGMRCHERLRKRVAEELESSAPNGMGREG